MAFYKKQVKDDWKYLILNCHFRASVRVTFYKKIIKLCIFWEYDIQWKPHFAIFLLLKIFQDFGHSKCQMTDLRWPVSSIELS